MTLGIFLNYWRSSCLDRSLPSAAGLSVCASSLPPPCPLPQQPQSWNHSPSPVFLLPSLGLNAEGLYFLTWTPSQTLGSPLCPSWPPLVLVIIAIIALHHSKSILPPVLDLFWAQKLETSSPLAQVRFLNSSTRLLPFSPAEWMT